MREQTILVDPQSAITKDNVSASIAGNIYFRFKDPFRALYGASTPVYAITQHAQASMRAVLGTLLLDETFHNRQVINKYVLESLEKATEPWGLEVLRYEVTSITTEQQIHDAMNKQAAAERQRREDVLRGEAIKRTAELTSEGERQKLINESEGYKTKKINEATADAESIKLNADADFYRVMKDAEAKANSIRIISDAIKEDLNGSALKYDLSQKWFKEFGQVVGKSNTIIIPGDITSVDNMMTRALTLFQNLETNDGIAK